MKAKPSKLHSLTIYILLYIGTRMVRNVLGLTHRMHKSHQMVIIFVKYDPLDSVLRSFRRVRLVACLWRSNKVLTFSEKLLKLKLELF